jgi:putative FmdB family regulatory protein
MPTYDFKCPACGSVFELTVPIADREARCECGGAALKQFSPNRNILIPGMFRMDRGWNNAPGSTGEPWSRNSTVHTPKRTSFTQEFDKAWEKAGRP